MSLTQKTWDEMSNQAKYNYLKSNDLVIKSQTFLNKDSKVGDAKISTGYKAFCGDVEVSHWCESEKEARTFALGHIEDFNKPIPETVE
ncbi:MAG: hypothetical protein M9949_06000 [Candidatus Kapabacteria bacterium]|nr:hypothetical protein [Candidatus Kapabacteria bacterium]